MKKVFEHPTYEMVGLCQSILEGEGIVTLIKNEGVTQAEGVFFGESAYPQLWVVEDGDYEKAVELLRPHLEG